MSSPCLSPFFDDGGPRRAGIPVNVTDSSPRNSSEYYVFPRPSPFSNTKAPELYLALNNLGFQHGYPQKAGQARRSEAFLSSFFTNFALFPCSPTPPSQAIRKKIESELARKRTISTTAHGGPRGKKGGKGAGAAKGTVAALKPSQALTVPDNITVADASQLCAAKRTDCVLVVDEEEGLSGIFTAKDLAFRVSKPRLFSPLNEGRLTNVFRLQVTAEGLDPRTTLVSAIMTKNPMVTRDTTSATEALQLMVQRGFRHLVR